MQPSLSFHHFLFPGSLLGRSQRCGWRSMLIVQYENTAFLNLWHRNITLITCCFPYILIVFLSSPNVILGLGFFEVGVVFFVLFLFFGFLLMFGCCCFCFFFLTKPCQVICICCYTFSYSPKDFPTPFNLIFLLSHSICFIFPPFLTIFATKGLLSTEHD